LPEYLLEGQNNCPTYWVHLPTFWHGKGTLHFARPGPCVSEFPIEVIITLIDDEIAEIDETFEYAKKINDILDKINVSNILPDKGVKLSFKDTKPEIQLKAIYHLEKRTITLNVTKAQRRDKVRDIDTGILFQMNIHRNLREPEEGEPMKVLHYTEAAAETFNNDTVKGVTGRVVIGKADEAENFCMRVFTIAPGGNSPHHSHEWEHEIFVHEGEGELFREGAFQTVRPGDTIFIPGHEEHQFKNSSTEPFTFVCLVPQGAPEL